MPYRTHSINFAATDITQNVSLRRWLNEGVLHSGFPSDTSVMGLTHPNNVAIFLALASSLSTTVPNDYCTLLHSHLTYKFDSVMNRWTYVIPYNLGTNPVTIASNLGKLEIGIVDAQLDFVKFELEYLKEVLLFANEEQSRFIWDNNFLMAVYALYLHEDYSSGYNEWQKIFNTHTFAFTHIEFIVAPNNADQSITRPFNITKTSTNLLNMRGRILRFIDVWLTKRNKESKHVSFNEHPNTAKIREYENNNTLRSSRLHVNANWLNERVDTSAALFTVEPLSITTDNSSIYEIMSCDTYIKGWNSFKKYLSAYRVHNNYNPSIILNALSVLWRKKVAELREDLLSNVRDKNELANSFFDYYNNVLNNVVSNSSTLSTGVFPQLKICYGCDKVYDIRESFRVILYGLYIGTKECRSLCTSCVNMRYVQSSVYNNSYIPLSRYLRHIHGSVLQPISTASTPLSINATSIIQDYRYDVLRVLKFQSLVDGTVQHRDTATPEELYFGVELELEVIKTKANNENVAHALNELTGKKTVCFKRDGSIGYGFEVVSAPMTEEVHCMENNVWQQICESAHRPNMMAHSRPNLGLHIHVSRSGLSGLTIGKLIYFVNNPVNSPFVSAVAGRDANSFCKKFNKTVTSDVKVNKEAIIDPSTNTRTQRTVSYATRDTRGGDRYQAINVLPKHTIEFRIFKSTLSWRSICAKIQFVKSLIEYVNQSSVRQLTFKEYIKWLKLSPNKGRYQFIYRWLVFKKWIERRDKFDPKLAEQGKQEGYETNMYNEQDEAA